MVARRILRRPPRLIGVLLLGAGASVILTACKAPAPDPVLSDREYLIRLSLDLTGARPSEEDFEAVEADPGAIDGILERYLDDERFGAQVREIFAPVFQTRLDLFQIRAQDYGLTDDAAFQRAVGEEPLRVVSQIAVEDLPWTEAVTGDWTMANEVTGAVWPLDYPAGETGWRSVRYTDGRPSAGVLSTNAMWWRYESNGVSYNRGRANAVSRIFLCEDFFERPVDFDRDIDLTDPSLVAEAQRENPGCVACHQALDPIASYLFGFHYAVPDQVSELTNYHPERERMWQGTTGVPPGFFGEPGFTLSDLGRQIAADRRFVSCAVETVWEGLLRDEAVILDNDALIAHREAFLEGGLTLRALIRSVVKDPRYRASLDDERNVRRKLVSPGVLASQVEALTGYRFTMFGYDMMESDLFGLRTLAGGVNGYTGGSPARRATPTMVLVQERLAEAAAYWAVGQESETARQNRELFRAVELDALREDDPDGFVRQAQRLHRLLFGTRPAVDSEEVTSVLDLWDTAYLMTGDPAESWAITLSALLRDPDILLY